MVLQLVDSGLYGSELLATLVQNLDNEDKLSLKHLSMLLCVLCYFLVYSIPVVYFYGVEVGVEADK